MIQMPKTPDIARHIFPKLTWSKPAEQQTLYLTFDDGPTPGVTDWVLDLLSRYNAKATFFCLGKNVVLYPDLFQRIINEGHTVGNHTYHHLNAWNTPVKSYLQDIAYCQQIFHSTLFRPPYGKLRPGTRRKIRANYKIIMWDILSYDFDETIKGEECVDNVISNAKSGSIVVFHDSHKAKSRLQYSLPRVLDYYHKKNYHFIALEG